MMDTSLEDILVTNRMERENMGKSLARVIIITARIRTEGPKEEKTYAMWLSFWSTPWKGMLGSNSKINPFKLV